MNTILPFSVWHLFIVECRLKADTISALER